MIKRYSTNFSYRQNRDRAGVYGSSLGSEGSRSLGAGAEPSSYPRFGGAGGSLSSAYGRSWISRMEQRQGLGTGGAFARTASLEDATAAATSSSASRYRTISGAAATNLAGGGLTPSPRSHEDDWMIWRVCWRPDPRLEPHRSASCPASGMSAGMLQGSAARPKRRQIRERRTLWRTRCNRIRARIDVRRFQEADCVRPVSARQIRCREVSSTIC